MFCSKCGKTLPPDGDKCPACGLPIGESRFDGSPHTSAQAHILPGDDVHQVMTQTYTRTNYTTMGDADPSGDVDSRTTYRPAYGGDAMPEDLHRDMRAAVDAMDAEPEEDELPPDLSPRRASPSTRSTRSCRWTAWTCPSSAPSRLSPRASPASAPTSAS